MKKMMKKNMKKIVSIALVLVLLLVPFSYLLNVKALEITTTEVSGKNVVSNTSSITVSDVGAGDSLGAYKILDALYDAQTNEISYQFTSLFENFKTSDYATVGEGETAISFSALTVDDYLAFGSTDLTTEQTEKFETLYTQFSKYVKSLGTSATADVALTSTAGATTVTASDVVVGSYLILPISTVRIYSVMIANVEIVAENNAWSLKPATVTAKSVAISDVFPSGSDELGGTGKAKSIISKDLSSASVVQGEEYIYIVSTPIPSYPANASNTKFTIVETLAEGIDFKGYEKMYISDGAYSDSTAIQGNASGQFVSGDKTIATATYSESDRTLTIEFTYSNLSGTEVEVHYTAALGTTAAFGTSYQSKSVLTYSVDPYGTATKTTNASIANAITYGLKIDNVKKDANSTKLVGAEFELYKVNSVGEKTGSAIATATVNTDGYIVFNKGIAATNTDTTYVLVQTKASAGYRVAAAKNIVLNLNNTSVTTADGTSYYDATSKTFIVTVENTEAGLLPSTGGLGTILYTLIGLFIITFSATAVVYYRKKKNAVTE